MAGAESAADLLGSRATADLGPLVGEARRAQILELAARFPVPVRAVGYECRLAGDDARVDYNLAFFAGSALEAALGGVRSELTAAPGWRRLLALLDPWSRGQSELTPLVPFVCLAFEDASSRLPVPSVSLCVDPEFYVRKLGKVLAPVPARQVEQIARLCARELSGEALDSTALERLYDVLAGSEGVEARHLSLMLARSPATLKLDVRITSSALPRFLERRPWLQGPSVDGLVAELSSLLPKTEHLLINVPLVTTPGALEVEVLTDRGDASTTQRFALLDRLVALGISSREKADALKLLWSSPLVHDAAGRAIGRSFYLKLKFHVDGRRQAKAYLGLLPRGTLAITSASVGLVRRDSFRTTESTDEHR